MIDSSQMISNDRRRVGREKNIHTSRPGFPENSPAYKLYTRQNTFFMYTQLLKQKNIMLN